MTWISHSLFFFSLISAKMIIMIYLKKTFEYISFLQKLEREKWKNEIFKSIIIMNKMNYQWLQRMNFRLLISKDVILTKFLMIKDYQWNSLSWYENESKHEIDYWIYISMKYICCEWRDIFVRNLNYLDDYIFLCHEYFS